MVHKNVHLKIYALCTPERYDFMHCDLQANPPLAYHCFDYVVAEGDKIVVGGGNSVDIPEDVFSATTKSSDVGNGSSSLFVALGVFGRAEVFKLMFSECCELFCE